MQKNLKKWLIILYGATAFIALCLVLSVYVFNDEGSNGFEKALNSLFDVLFQAMIVFYYVVFVIVTSGIGMLYGHFKKMPLWVKSFKPYLIGSIIALIVMIIIAQF